MRRDWRAAAGIIGLVSGLYFARDSIRLMLEDLGSDMPTPAHNFYSSASVEYCRMGWETRGQSLHWEEICHSHPHVVEYLAFGLLILTAALLIWIWWKPHKI